MDATLRQRWKATEVVLERACTALPSAIGEVQAQFEAAVAEFRHYLSYNEFKLALDALCEAADLVACPGEVCETWGALRIY